MTNTNETAFFAFLGTVGGRCSKTVCALWSFTPITISYRARTAETIHANLFRSSEFHKWIMSISQDSVFQGSTICDHFRTAMSLLLVRMALRLKVHKRKPDRPNAGDSTYTSGAVSKPTWQVPLMWASHIVKVGKAENSPPNHVVRSGSTAFARIAAGKTKRQHLILGT